MDPVGATASGLTLAQVFSQALALCLEVKEAKKSIQDLSSEVKSLRAVLAHVEALAELEDSNAVSSPNSLHQQNSPLRECSKVLDEIVKILEAGRGKYEMKRFGYRALKWPFIKKDIEKLCTRISNHKASLSIAMLADQSYLIKAFHQNDRRQKIWQWLAPPDPSFDYNAACIARHPDTGSCLIQNQKFMEWKVTPSSLCSLYGIPGCGKTILCTTAIEEVESSLPPVATLYFYFKFDDPGKQRSEVLVRSLIAQLYQWIFIQTAEIPIALNNLFVRNHRGHRQPKLTELVSLLKDLIVLAGRTFIFVDALDECTDKKGLLDLLKVEQGIEQPLHSLTTQQICVQDLSLDEDICKYIYQRVHVEPEFMGKFIDINTRHEIEEILVDGAQGMFQWVACQLDSLGKCLNTRDLRRTLKQLPPTVEETYARILNDIEPRYNDSILKVLQFLVYCARPLSIEEVAEVLAVYRGRKGRFDPEDRLWDPRRILTICSSLVTTKTLTPQFDLLNRPRVQEVWLAHSSVKEYLLSENIRNSAVSRFSVDNHAEAVISQTCLIYLLHFNESITSMAEHLGHCPLAIYAAKYWMTHAMRATHDSERTNQLIIELFRSPHACRNWIRICDPDYPWWAPEMSWRPKFIATPLYYASLLGLGDIIQQLLEQGSEIGMAGGRYGNALQAASVRGHDSIVLQLIEHGVNINAQGGDYGNALIAASSHGNNMIVQILLNNGANPGVRDDQGRTPLIWAAKSQHKAVVQTLLDHRDCNAIAVDTRRKTALHYAVDIYQCDVGLVQSLLDAGICAADADADNMTPLHYAAAHGSQELVKLLITHGVNVDVRIRREVLPTKIKGREHPHQEEPNKSYVEGLTSLHSVAYFGNAAMASSLLVAGADANAVDELSQTPLHLAIHHKPFGSQKGDVWNKDSHFMMEAAYEYCENFEDEEMEHLKDQICQQRKDLVGLLLHSGSNPSAQDCFGRTSLHLIPYGGHRQSEFVQLLLDAGADATLQDFSGKTALQIAASCGDLDSVAILLEASRDITVTDNRGLNVLHHAAYSQNHQVIDLVLRNKDAPCLTNARDKAGLTALHHGVRGLRTGPLVAKRLIDGGVDPHAVDNKGMTALHHALGCNFLGCPFDVVETLLDHSISASAVDLKGRSCLHFAVRSWRPVPVETLQLLVDRGASLTASDFSGMNVLHHASSASSIDTEMLCFLLRNGVGLNERDHYGRTPLRHTKDQKSHAEKSLLYEVQFRGDRWARYEELLIQYGAVE